MKHWFSWFGQWMSCSCCRPVVVTIQELITSTGLPDDSRQRLWRVMQQYGYADGNAVVVGVRRLTSERLEAAASAAELEPPLTMLEVDALLDAAGKRVMIEGRVLNFHAAQGAIPIKGER